MRFVKPLDHSMLDKIAASHDVIVTIEENVVAGGAGSGVNEYLVAQGQTKPVLNLGLPDRYMDHGSQKELLSECGLDAAGIIKSINAFYTASDANANHAQALGTMNNVGNVGKRNK